MSAPGTPKASEAAVAAVQDALGCHPMNGRFWDDEVTDYCTNCDHAWTERGCPVAVAAADAAAPHIAAQALRDLAEDDAWDFACDHGTLTPLPAWLHDRADRIEAGQ